MFKRRQQAQPRLDRSEEFASFVAPRLDPKSVRMASLLTTAFKAPVVVSPKIVWRVNQNIRDSANGEECEIRLPGCPQDPQRTIWSHNRHLRAGKAKGLKALDLNGCYACTHCDAIYDGQVRIPKGWTRDQVELAWYQAHDKSLVKLAQKGLV